MGDRPRAAAAKQAPSVLAERPAAAKQAPSVVAERPAAAKRPPAARAKAAAGVTAGSAKAAPRKRAGGKPKAAARKPAASAVKDVHQARIDARLAADRAAAKAAAKIVLPFKGENIFLLKLTEDLAVSPPEIVATGVVQFLTQPPRGLQQHLDIEYTSIPEIVKQYELTTLENIQYVYRILTFGDPRMQELFSTSGELAEDHPSYTPLYPNLFPLWFTQHLRWLVESELLTAELLSQWETWAQEIGLNIGTQDDIDDALYRAKRWSNARKLMIDKLETFEVPDYPYATSDIVVLNATYRCAAVLDGLELQDLWTLGRTNAQVPIIAYKSGRGQLYVKTYRGLRQHERDKVHALAQRQEIAEMSNNTFLAFLTPLETGLTTTDVKNFQLFTLMWEQPVTPAQAVALDHLAAAVTLSTGDATEGAEAAEASAPTAPLVPTLMAVYTRRYLEVERMLTDQEWPITFDIQTQTTNLVACFSLVGRYLQSLDFFRWSVLEELGLSFMAWDEGASLVAKRVDLPVFEYVEPWWQGFKSLLPPNSEVAPEMKVTFANRQLAVPLTSGKDSYPFGTPSLYIEVSNADSIAGIEQVRAYLSYVLRLLPNPDNMNVTRAKLSDAYPEIFVANYSSFCPVQRQPFLITEDDVESARSNGQDVLQFETRNPDAPVIYLTCEVGSDQYVGLKANTLSNYEIYPFIPCCYAQKQNKPQDEGRVARGSAGSREVKGETTVLEDKVVGPIAQELLDWLQAARPRTERRGYQRYGVTPPGEQLQSILNCLNYATDQRYTRQDLLKLNPAVVANSMWDYTADEIREIWRNGYLDPLLHVRAFMELYNVNVILVDAGQVRRPRTRNFPVYDWRTAPDGTTYQPAVILYLSDITPNEVQCELVVEKPEGSTSSGRRRTPKFTAMFPGDVFVAAYQQQVVIRRREGLAPVVSLVSLLARIGRITAQWIDDHGMAQAFQINVANNVPNFWVWALFPTSPANVSTVDSAPWEPLTAAAWRWLRSNAQLDDIPDNNDNVIARRLTLQTQEVILPVVALNDEVLAVYQFVGQANPEAERRRALSSVAEVVFTLLEWAYTQYGMSWQDFTAENVIVAPTKYRVLQTPALPNVTEQSQVLEIAVSAVEGLVKGNKFVVPDADTLNALEYFLRVVVNDNPNSIHELPLQPPAQASTDIFTSFAAFDRWRSPDSELTSFLTNNQTPWFSRQVETQEDALNMVKAWDIQQRPGQEPRDLPVRILIDGAQPMVGYFNIKQEGLTWLAVMCLAWPLP